MRRWIWIGLIVLAVVFFRKTWELMFPFVIAFFIAALLNPLVNYLEQKTPLGRAVCTVIVFIFTGLLGSGLLLLGTTALLQSIGSFLDQLPIYRQTFMTWTKATVDSIDALYLRIPDSLLSPAMQNVDQMLLSIQRILTNFGTSFVTWLSSLPGLAVNLFIALLTAFLLTKDWHYIIHLLRELLPDEWRVSFDRAGAELGESLGRYILAQVVVIGITTLVYMLGLLLLGVDGWLAAGLFGGILDLVPIIGPAFIYLPWAIYAFVVGERTLALWLLALYGGISALRQLIAPKVVGDSLGVHPLAMIAGLYWGSILFGAKGFLITPLLLIFTKAVIKARRDVAASHQT
ncbi:MAG TPA: sporulation integral membrane protein YtvI [Firmicutes bacterium]|jgi:sporulation integral membrane protein YtvI|nr:sporulation integral membrane protein YtvI [Bacillota bacterium]